MADDAWWSKLNKNRDIQRAVNGRAAKIAARAQAISDSEGGTARIRVETSVRPKGRYQARVISDRPDEEFGSETQRRIRPLGRAQREV